MRARLSLLAVCATVSFALIGQLGVTASSGPAISGVKLREGLQHAADHPGDVLGSAAQYVRELGRDKSSVEASSGPAIEPVKLKKTAIESWKLKKGSPDAADPGDLAGDKSSVQASSEPAIEPVKLKKTAIESWKLKKGLQDAADPGDVLNNAAQYVRDLGRDKTSAKADSFFDAMEARARRELAYWRSTGAVGVFQHYFGVIKDISLNGFTVAETKLHEYNKAMGGLPGLLGFLQQHVEVWISQAKDAIARVQGHATSTGDAAARAAQGKAADVMGSAQDATRGVRSAAQDLKDSAAETVQGVSDSAKETADAIKQRGEL